MQPRDKKTSDASQNDAAGYRAWPSDPNLVRMHKEHGKAVGTVGTRQRYGLESLIWQGVGLFPHITIWSGYKVGTMGTEDQILTSFPPVPNRLVGLWVQTNPVMTRVSGYCSRVPTVPTVF